MLLEEVHALVYVPAVPVLRQLCFQVVHEVALALVVFQRSLLGFGIRDVALIRPCVDVFDPRVVRASMGSLFSLRIKVYGDFDAYLAEHPGRMLYPFMLDGSRSLPDVLAEPVPDAWTLVFGNEGSGLPPEFARMGQPVRIPSNEKIDSLNLSIAAAIGIYGFTQAFAKGKA